MSTDVSESVEFKGLDDLVLKLRATVECALREGTAIDHVEEDIFAQLLGMGHLLLGSLFDAMKLGDVGPTLEKNGKTLRRLPETTKRSYHSVFGNFELERFSYGSRQSQKHQAVPFDEHIGLPPTGFSLLLESWIGQLATDESFHEACSKLERILKLTIHVDSAEGIVNRLGKAAASVLESPPSIECENEAEVLVQTSDNKGIVLRNEFPQEVPKPVGAPSETHGPKPNCKRMACMAGVYSVDRNPRTPGQILDLLFHSHDYPALEGKAPRPKNPRYFARLTMVDAVGKQVGKSGEEQSQQWMTASTIRRRRRGQTLVVMHDGQPSLWENEKKLQEGWEQIEILDLLHVIPRIWTAAKILHPNTVETYVKDTLHLILMGGLRLVLMGFRRMTTMRKLPKLQEKEMRTLINYLETNKSRMKYNEYLEAGLPIATGFIEGACRHVIKDRLERTGMRWTRHGAQSLLKLRCIEASELWEPMMNDYRDLVLSRDRKNYFDLLATMAA